MPKSVRSTGGAARPWITAGSATAQWRARSARRYPPPPIRRSGPSFFTSPGGRIQTVLTNPAKTNIFISDPRKQTSGGRHQLGTPAGFKSELVAGFISECPAGFVGIRNYTDPDKIMMIVEPVVLRPLRAEWEVAKAKIEAIMAPALEGAGGGRTAARERGKRFEAARARAEVERDAFIDRLCGLRILDPACGSGNFLYLALQGVKDIEWRAILDCHTLGLGMAVPRVGPEILRGIEINPFAAELARTTIWIGDIQWRVRNAIHHHPRPVLRKLDSIECRDALLAPDGEGGFQEAEWPKADFIIGNPPFLGAKLMKGKLGVETTESIRSAFAGRLPGFTDLVCYWFEKGRTLIEEGKGLRVGLVATNSIRKNTNLPVMRRIAATTRIFEAWSEEKWTVEGAMVDVSLICFGDSSEGAIRLNGETVAVINPDLTSGLDLTQAKPLPENRTAPSSAFRKAVRSTCRARSPAHG